MIWDQKEKIAKIKGFPISCYVTGNRKYLSEDDLGAESFKNAAAEATGVLVAEAAEHLGVPLTPSIATPLFAAVATDTGWFRFASVSSQTYRTAATLIDAGASPVE